MIDPENDLKQIENVFSGILEEDKKIRDKQISELDSLRQSIPLLLREIEKIRARRQGIIEVTKANFNVFTIVLKANDEVRLHTRFITALLDGSKDATHGLGTLFLKLFLETIDRIKVENVNVVAIPEFSLVLDEHDNKFQSIHKEFHTGDKGNIDIFIKFTNAAVAIENKIGAGEQDNQLCGYYEYLEQTKKTNKFLFFLTLRGHNADSHNGNPYYKISYQKHIIPWLELCLEKTYNYPNINSVIAQYKKVVQQLLSSYSFEEEDMTKIKELVEKNPAIVKYVEEISECVDEFKKEIKGKFFEKLAEKVIGFDLNSWNENERDGYIQFDIASNNKFFKENDLSLVFGIAFPFDANCESYVGVAYSYEVNELLDEVKAVVDGIKRRISSCHNYHEPEDWWPAGWCIVGLGNEITLDFLSDAILNPDLIETRATEYATEIIKYIKIIEDCVPQ